VEVAQDFLAQCTPERYAVNKARMGRLARYSHSQLKQIRERLDIRYEQTTGGNLQLFRTQEGLDNAGLSTQVLAEAGVPFELLDADGCVAFDPGLHAARHELKGGLLLPMDETGNCPLFARALADGCRPMGWSSTCPQRCRPSRWPVARSAACARPPPPCVPMPTWSPAPVRQCPC
jgi:glycine/D-amino acid oxidase-like deaminating enzyme